MVLTENFPFRSKKIFDKMIRLAINKNHDVVFLSQNLKGSIFQKKDNKYKNIVNGFIPSKINKEMLLSRIGVASLFKISKIRSGDILEKNIGFIIDKNHETFIEINNNNIKNLSKSFFSHLNLDIN